MDVTSTNTVSNYAQSFLDGTATRAPKQQLGSDDFLKLLTTQLSNQDPMKPMEDTAFMAQMASFSSLEQMKTLSTNMSSFATQQSVMAASNYIGKTVTVTPKDAAAVTGVVSSVTITDGKPQLQINGLSYDAANITSIKPTPAATGSTTSTSSITNP